MGIVVLNKVVWRSHLKEVWRWGTLVTVSTLRWVEPLSCVCSDVQWDVKLSCVLVWSIWSAARTGQIMAILLICRYRYNGLLDIRAGTTVITTIRRGPGTMRRGTNNRIYWNWNTQATRLICWSFVQEEYLFWYAWHSGLLGQIDQCKN